VGVIASIEDLYRAHARLVFGYLLRRTRDEHLAADLLQETFVTATRAFLGWSGGSAEGWLLAIARSRLVDHARKHRAELPLPTEAELDAPPLPAVDAVEVDDVMARLRPEQARLLRMVYVDGFRTAELAAASGQKEGTVRMALMRAREAFRAAWDGNDDDERDVR
jgi:RNA polymerase sigma factor (sigma-70 family)